MITKMNKYDFLVYHAQYADFLQKLRDVGVLHVSKRHEGISENDDLRDKMQLRARITKNIYLCNNIIEKEDIVSQAENLPVETGLQLLTYMDGLLSEIEKLKIEIAGIQREQEKMEVWGDFSFKRLEQLRQNGFNIRFYSCAERKFKPEWEELYNAFKIAVVGATLYFVIITRNAISDIEADPVILSEKNASEFGNELTELKSKLDRKQKDLHSFALQNVNNLKYLALQTDEEIDMDSVRANTLKSADDTVMILEGYCPEDAEDDLKIMLEQEGIYYEISNPEIGDNIPIKLKNSAYTRLFEPITRLFSLPNYSELDPTPFLAPFFMLFFGLCLGDGGYGLLILIAATIAKKKLKSEMKGFATLGQVLGVATMVCGFATGSFFGIALDSVTWPWLADIKKYFITDNNYKEALGGYSPMMIFAVIIGLIQIFFGMAVNAAKIIKQHGLKYALAPIAWITGLIGSIITFGIPMLGFEMPSVLKYIFVSLIGISILLIFLYNSPDKYKSPVKGAISNIGSALWSAYNMATGLLGDTLSYIRLFALGLTGSILGGVFNSLALQFAGDISVPVLNWIVGLFILLFGHSINFGLCIIGALVHPMRLTFVEFYKNSGFEGGGEEYSPLKHKISIEH